MCNKQFEKTNKLRSDHQQNFKHNKSCIYINTWNLFNKKFRIANYTLMHIEYIEQFEEKNYEAII